MMDGGTYYPAVKYIGSDYIYQKNGIWQGFVCLI